MSDDKITCQICGGLTHAIQIHLKEEHSTVTVEQYQTKYPHAPLLSELAKRKIAEREAQQRVEAASAAKLVEVPLASPPSATVHSLAEARPGGIVKAKMHEVFGLGAVKAALNARGEPIMISTITSGPSSQFVPEKDKNYVFSIDLLKVVLMGAELGKPTYLWGYHGTGKTTMLEQVAAHTNRPLLRVQHTINTEEAHILGQYLVRDGSTTFELGPLPFCMLHGLVYLADEYDFAMPAVLGVYQPVLEGKALVIKEAPPELRIIKPHPNFRFVATGNTNGAGDETGLYQGAQIQNAANYSRFGIVEEVPYMPEKQEIAVISGQAGIDADDAKKLVAFATEIRNAFKAGRIGATVSPRELINAAQLGLVRGGDWRGGLKLSFSNKLTRTDKETVEQFAQRIFG